MTQKSSEPSSSSDVELLKIATTGRSFNAHDKQRMLAILREIEEREKFGGVNRWFVPNTAYSIDNLPKHKAFFEAGAKYDERLFCAGNRVGKSIAGAYETAVHLTGEYPDWWKGRVFDAPISAWACGKTSKVTRDTVQKELLGNNEVGSGMIPKNLILKAWSKPGTPRAIDSVEIRHVSGGVSTLSFKSYEEGVQSFYGTAREVCVTPDVEVMTSDGWTNTPTKGQKVLSYHDGNYIWANINFVHRVPYKGVMYNLKSRNNFNINVTPDHKWLVYNKATKQTYLKETKDLNTNEQLVIAAGALEEARASPYSDEFVSLVGWMVTDGCISNSNMYICQSLSYNSKKCKEIEALLSAESPDEFKVRQRPYGDGAGIMLHFSVTGVLRKRLLEVLGQDKQLPVEFINSLSSEQRQLLLNSIIAGDGMYTKHGGWSITSVQRSRIDSYQYLATLCGYRSLVVNNGSSSFSLNGRTKTSKRYDYTKVSVDALDISTYEYDGEVYCPNTDYGTAVFRTDKRSVVLSGQCWLDEESDEYIYSECYLRTATTNGIIYTTFTPKHGITPFVLNFFKDADYLADSPRLIFTEEEMNDG